MQNYVFFPSPISPCYANHLTVDDLPLLIFQVQAFFRLAIYRWPTNYPTSPTATAAVAASAAAAAATCRVDFKRGYADFFRLLCISLPKIVVGSFVRPCPSLGAQTSRSPLVKIVAQYVIGHHYADTLPESVRHIAASGGRVGGKEEVSGFPKPKTPSSPSRGASAEVTGLCLDECNFLVVGSGLHL